jgi:hypothetical protein
MKIARILSSALPLALMGCVHTQTDKTVYSPNPPPTSSEYITPAPPAPTSTIPLERVYPYTVQQETVNNVSPAAPDSTHQPMMPPPIPMEQRYLATQGAAVKSTDLDLAQRIRADLNNDPALPAGRRVDATVKDGVVWLRGTVPTDQDRQNIAERVAAIPGVARVENGLGADMP